MADFIKRKAVLRTGVNTLAYSESDLQRYIWWKESTGTSTIHTVKRYDTAQGIDTVIDIGVTADFIAGSITDPDLWSNNSQGPIFWRGELWLLVYQSSPSSYLTGLYRYLAPNSWQLVHTIAGSAFALVPISDTQMIALVKPAPANPPLLDWRVLSITEPVEDSFSYTDIGPISVTTDVPAFFDGGFYNQPPSIKSNGTFNNQVKLLPNSVFIVDWPNFPSATRRANLLFQWNGTTYAEINAALWFTSTGWSGDVWVQEIDNIDASFAWRDVNPGPDEQFEYMRQDSWGTWRAPANQTINPGRLIDGRASSAVQEIGTQEPGTAFTLEREMTAEVWGAETIRTQAVRLLPVNIFVFQNGTVWYMINTTADSGVWADPNSFGSIPTATTGYREPANAIPGSVL